MQETLGPLKGAGRWLAMGTIGAALLGLGLSIVILGILRLVQTEWHRSASGALSWLAYLVVLVLCVALAALVDLAHQPRPPEQGVEVMAKRPDPVPTEPITRDDLERGFLNIQRGVRGEIEDRRSTVLTVGAGLAVLVVVVIFLLGRRSGKKKTTFVEIRRV